VNNPTRLPFLLPVLALLFAAPPAGADAFFDSGNTSVSTTDDGRVYLGFGVSAYFFTAPERRNVGTI